MKDGSLIIHTDGGARGNPGPSACAFTVELDGKMIFSDSLFLGNRTNNFAEYQGVILALKWLISNYKKNSENTIFFYLDSELVVRQLNGVYKVKDLNLKKLYEEVIRAIIDNHLNIDFRHIVREKNKQADLLVNETLDKNLTETVRENLV